MGIAKAEGFENIYYHSSFLSEKEDMKISTYDNWLSRQLGLLDCDGLAVLNTRAFEKLVVKGEAIYCIRRPKTPGNPRSLFFALVEDRDSPPAFIMLTAFGEKADGDYTRGISVAVGRIKQIKKELR